MKRVNVESIHCRCFPQGHNSKDNISGSFIFQDLNDSYPVLAPIRKPGPRKKRGGDTIVIHGSQKPSPSVSTCDGEIDENEFCTGCSKDEEFYSIIRNGVDKLNSEVERKVNSE